MRPTRISSLEMEISAGTVFALEEPEDFAFCFLASAPLRYKHTILNRTKTIFSSGSVDNSLIYINIKLITNRNTNLMSYGTDSLKFGRL